MLLVLKIIDKAFKMDLTRVFIQLIVLLLVKVVKLPKKISRNFKYLKAQSHFALSMII